MIKLVSKFRQWLVSYDRWLTRLGLDDYGCPCANIGQAVKDKKFAKHPTDKESELFHS